MHMKMSWPKPIYLSMFSIFLSMPSMVTALVAQAPQKETIDGIRNFTKVDDAVGCGGATEPRALAEIAKRGYRSVVNLREATEAGAAIEESKTAAEAAGLKFIHLPFNSSKPDAAVVDSFIKAVSDKANQPVYIHCASANRAAALLVAKRMLVDKWTEEKAMAEAKAIGLTNEAVRQFVMEYVKGKQDH